MTAQQLQDPTCWEKRPYLPLRRGTPENIAAFDLIYKRICSGLITPAEFVRLALPEIELGFLIEDFGPMVFVGNVFIQTATPSKRHIKYPSFDAIIDDGWESDD